MSGSFYKMILPTALVLGMIPIASAAQERKGYIDIAWEPKISRYECVENDSGNKFGLSGETYNILRKASALRETVDCKPVEFDHFKVAVKRLDKKESGPERSERVEGGKMHYERRIDGLELGGEYEITLDSCTKSGKIDFCFDRESVKGKVTKSAD